MRQHLKLRRRFDSYIPLIGLGLSLFGLVMILSSSQVNAAEQFGDPYHFFIRQLMAWFIGLVGFFVFFKINLEWLYQHRFWFLIGGLAILLLVFIPGIGGEVAGVYRWVRIGNLQFQPSDFTKLGVVLFLAGWLATKGEDIKNFKKTFLPFLAIVFLAGLLVELGSDLDTMAVVLITAVAMFFAARAPLYQIAVLVLIGLLAGLALIYITPYRLDRLQTAIGQSDLLTTGYHANQAAIAIGSGGWWGVGFGQGISKYAYLPESHTDSIFAVMAEELGFIRTALILALFFVLAWRCYRISATANSRYVSLLAVGGGFLIISQALINVGGMLGLIPLSGITLPFISSGGSSLIAHMTLLGLLTNISREVNDA